MAARWCGDSNWDLRATLQGAKVPHISTAEVLEHLQQAQREGKLGSLGGLSEVSKDERVEALTSQIQSVLSEMAEDRLENEADGEELTWRDIGIYFKVPLFLYRLGLTV